MKPSTLCVAVWFSLFGALGSLCHAQQQAGSVYLDAARSWRIGNEKLPWVHLLARELTRQAFLIAARDELGLVTRDAWLGDAKPPQDEAAWDITTTPGSPMIVTIVRGSGPQQATLSRHEIRRSGSIDYRAWATQVENLSRTEFVETLKQAGLQGNPHPHREDLAVPEPIETLLAEMNFLSQFRAVRELHGVIGSQGESSALLGALVRGYANLGMLTDDYWHPVRKVFKARALLYAQRMLARDEDSPVAKWHRAYAAALTGLPVWALADLKAADAAFQAMSEHDRPTQPAWVQLLGPFCRYEVDALGEHTGDPKVGQLAALLKYLAVEHAGGEEWAIQTGLDTVRLAPECYRVHHRLRELTLPVPGSWAPSEPGKILRETLYARLRGMPGLPEEAGRAVEDGASVGPPPDDPDDAAVDGEYRVRRRLIDALLTPREAADSGAESAVQEPTVSDGGEPSWAALGLLIRELSFLQAYHRVRFEPRMAGVSVERWLASMAPLVEGHPCRDLLGAFVMRPDVVREALSKLPQLDTAGGDYPLRDIYQALSVILDAKVRNELYQNYGNLHVKQWWNHDDLAGDFVVALDERPSSVAPPKTLLDMLLKIDPHSPLARAMLVTHYWKSIQANAEQWDQESARYPLLAAAFAKHYKAAGRLDDAARCFEAAIKIAPAEWTSFEQLAAIYKQRGQTDRWLATLEECLKHTSYTVGRTLVRCEITRHFMKQRQWRKALSYAEQVTSEDRAWWLGSAAMCHEALEEWKVAEECYQRNTNYDPMACFRWYFFCRRTGEGDVDAAGKLARTFAKNLARLPVKLDPIMLSAFYLLEAQPEKAMAEIEPVVARDANPYNAIWMALIAEQLGDVNKRASVLELARTLPQKTDGGKKAIVMLPGIELPEPAFHGAAELADLIITDLAQGGKGQIDVHAADKLCLPLNDEERLSFHYLLAQYLNSHGQRELADHYGKSCMGWIRDEAPFRTLAGAMLLEHDLTSAEYKSLLEPDAEKAKPAEGNE